MYNSIDKELTTNNNIQLSFNFGDYEEPTFFDDEFNNLLLCDMLGIDDVDEISIHNIAEKLASGKIDINHKSNINVCEKIQE